MLVDEEGAKSTLVEAPDFKCPKGHPLGARRKSLDHDWEPDPCYWCVTLPAKRRDVARRRALGHVVAGVDLDKALAAYKQMPPFKGNLGRRKITLEVGHRMDGSVGGRAWLRQRRIRVAAGPDATPERALEVLVHELVHLACPNHHHDERFRRVFRRACLEIWGIEVPIDAKPFMRNISYGMGEVAAKLLGKKIDREEIDTFPPDPKPKTPSRAAAMAEVVEKRAAHALAMHKKAATRLKRAKTLESKWRKKVAYYERQAAKKGS
jgi:hypothetical protein